MGVRSSKILVQGINLQNEFEKKKQELKNVQNMSDLGKETVSTLLHYGIVIAGRVCTYAHLLDLVETASGSGECIASALEEIKELIELHHDDAGLKLLPDTGSEEKVE